MVMGGPALEPVLGGQSVHAGNCDLGPGKTTTTVSAVKLTNGSTYSGFPRLNTAPLAQS